MMMVSTATAPSVSDRFREEIPQLRVGSSWRHVARSAERCALWAPPAAGARVSLGAGSTTSSEGVPERAERLRALHAHPGFAAVQERIHWYIELQRGACSVADLLLMPSPRAFLELRSGGCRHET